MNHHVKSTLNHGLLGLVLKMSRVVGMAPFTCAPKFQVSTTYATCGKVFVSINGLFVISSVVADFWLTIEEKSVISATQVVGVIQLTVLAALSVLGVFTAASRLTRMADYLQKLNQFNKNLNKKIEKRLQKKSIYKILVLVGGFFVLLVIDFVGRFILFTNLNQATKFLNALLVLNLYPSIMLLLQMSLFAKRVTSYLIALNNSLQDIRDGNRGRLITIENSSSRQANRNGEKSSIVLKIRELATLYQLICETVLKTNEADGFVVLLFLAFIALFLQRNIFLAIFLGISNLPTIYILHGVVLPLTFALYSIAFIIFYIEPFHQTHIEMERTHELITNLKSLEEDVEMEHELELFHRMLFLNKVKYSPLDLFTIDRELVMKLFSALITYLVITLEYGPEIRHVFHSNATESRQK